jgi:hypothetical protein
MYFRRSPSLAMEVHVNIRTALAIAGLAAGSFFAGALWAQKPGKPMLDSHIWSATDARTSKGSWGSISIYTEDGQPSRGTTSVLTAELTFLPGKQLQPPHQHADEEFQYVIEGLGDVVSRRQRTSAAGRRPHVPQADGLARHPRIERRADAVPRVQVKDARRRGIDSPRWRMPRIAEVRPNLLGNGECPH